MDNARNKRMILVVLVIAGIALSCVFLSAAGAFAYMNYANAPSPPSTSPPPSTRPPLRWTLRVSGLDATLNGTYYEGDDRVGENGSKISMYYSDARWVAIAWSTLRVSAGGGGGKTLDLSACKQSMSPDNKQLTITCGTSPGVFVITAPA